MKKKIRRIVVEATIAEIFLLFSDSRNVSMKIERLIIYSISIIV